MKLNFKIFAVLLLALLSIGCDEDSTLDQTSPDGILLTDPGIGIIVINQENLSNQAVSINWTDYNNSGATYSIDMATDDLFENSMNLGSTTQNSFTLTQEEVNTAMTTLNSEPFKENTAYLRIGADSLLSNSISFVVINIQDAPVLVSEIDGEAFVLLEENASEEAIEIEWLFLNDVNLDITYDVEVALADTDFEIIESLGSVSNENSLSVETSALNVVAQTLGIQAGDSGNLDIRIKASYPVSNTETVEEFSNTITITATTYVPTDLPIVYIVGNFLAAGGYGSDWNPADAVPIAASKFGATDYEGYVYMPVEDLNFKVLPTNESFEGDYGDDGTNMGVLLQEGESNIVLSDGGYYWIQADTEELTYSAQLTSWAITGDATPLGWPSDTVADQDMTYNTSTGKWEITIALDASGTFKFRANDDWAINYGDADADGILDFDSTNLSIDQSGTYLVELDLTNPREYTYTATLQ